MVFLLEFFREVNFYNKIAIALTLLFVILFFILIFHYIFFNLLVKKKSEYKKEINYLTQWSASNNVNQLKVHLRLLDEQMICLEKNGIGLINLSTELKSVKLCLSIIFTIKKTLEAVDSYIKLNSKVPTDRLSSIVLKYNSLVVDVCHVSNNDYLSNLLLYLREVESLYFLTKKQSLGDEIIKATVL